MCKSERARRTSNQTKRPCERMWVSGNNNDRKYYMHTLKNDIETLSNVESFEMGFSLHLLLISSLFFCHLLLSGAVQLTFEGDIFWKENKKQKQTDKKRQTILITWWKIPQKFSSTIICEQQIVCASLALYVCVCECVNFCVFARVHKAACCRC